MPGYPYIAKTILDYQDIRKEIELLMLIGNPYTDADTKNIEQDIKIQAGVITDPALVENFKKRYPKVVIRKFHKNAELITEMDALIAYLQAIGNKVDLKTNQGRDW